MHDRKKLLAGSGFFVVAGLLCLLFGQDGETRLVGLLCVLFFGGCALVPLVLMRPPRRGLASPLPIDVDAERGLLFALGRTRQVVVLIAAVAIVAACVVIALSGAVVLGVVCAVTFAVCAVVPAVRGLLRPRGLALTPTRIVTVGFGQGEVAWEDVEAVGTLQQGAVLLVGIEAANVRRRNAFGRFNRRFLPTDIAVPADDPEALVRAVVAYLEHPERRQELARTG
jgi:hypothetical protein